jgi:hypothetical protein
MRPSPPEARVIDLLLVALFQAAAGDPAPAETTAQAPAAEQPAPRAEATTPENPQQQRRCRNERVVGSRMPVRVCMTPQEEMAAEEDAREMVRRGQGTYPMAGD